MVPEPEPEPVDLDQPEPEDIDVEADMKEMTQQLNERIEQMGSALIGPMLVKIGCELDGIADYVTKLDDDGKAKLYDEHLDSLKDISKKWNKTMNALNAAQKTRAQGQG